ncbi:TetR family transcriptional regulator [Vibrio sp. S4M6]|uniref:TetR family transcriptional regulator n=1 Tax=Vibrio sinus TaxID=2946865 RepID=UPI002029CB3C|nr:TetR family transcriptional regulator [Vibrio sinus]MCL9780622.1 TetR family transcriptional regulator [Vibrio sinus]
MPKRSKEDTEITIRKITDAVVDQLIRLGYDNMSYTTLSQQTGVSRTGISHHFPKKTDFTAALDGRIFKMFVEHLDFENTLQDFAKSWMSALNNNEFVALLKLLFHHIVSTGPVHEFAEKGVDRLYKSVQTQFGELSDQELDLLLGKSLVKMSQRS